MYEASWIWCLGSGVWAWGLGALVAVMLRCSTLMRTKCLKLRQAQCFLALMVPNTLLLNIQKIPESRIPRKIQHAGPSSKPGNTHPGKPRPCDHVGAIPSLSISQAKQGRNLQLKSCFGWYTRPFPNMNLKLYAPQTRTSLLCPGTITGCCLHSSLLPREVPGPRISPKPVSSRFWNAGECLKDRPQSSSPPPPTLSTDSNT